VIQQGCFLSERLPERGEAGSGFGMPSCDGRVCVCDITNERCGRVAGGVVRRVCF